MQQVALGILHKNRGTRTGEYSGRVRCTSAQRRGKSASAIYQIEEHPMGRSAKFIITAVVMLLLLPLLGRLSDKHAPSVPPVVHRESVPFAPAVRPTVQRESVPFAPPVQVAAPQSSGVIENAYRNHTGGLPVLETGTVSRVLSDDNEGSRHQRFIVRLPSGHTVLIAHNIDIAPRIGGLREGDQITFSGVYEWNDKGGVVHWTHHDPGRRHAGGYLLHNRVTYQ
jgi:hypothetical protein